MRVPETQDVDESVGGDRVRPPAWRQIAGRREKGEYVEFDASTVFVLVLAAGFLGVVAWPSTFAGETAMCHAVRAKGVRFARIGESVRLKQIGDWMS